MNPSGADTSWPSGQPPSAPDVRTPFSILVADDDPDMRLYLRRCLAQTPEVPIGRVVDAADGEAALALARKISVHLIIADVVMPRMDGLTLCRALADDAALRHVPVLLITGERPPPDLPEGAAGVLAKPFNAGKLLAWLQRLLRATPDEAHRLP